jgi:hypothetical protein
MKRLRPYSIFAWFVAAACTLFACSDSDSLLYDEDDGIYLQVHAEMAITYELDSARVRADTISPLDTLIFIGEITPSRQARYREYYWTIDGKDFANDMNFRKPVTEAGYHEICFVVLDNFGDTLRDTLRLWVVKPPVIDTEHFIPARGTQGLSPQEGISFAWNGYDPDSLTSVKFHLIIKEPRRMGQDYRGWYLNSDPIMDTILDNPSFIYWDNPNFYYRMGNLKYYVWEVYAINEFGLESDTLIQGDFFTGGYGDEGGIQAFVSSTNIRYCSSSYHMALNVLDSNSSPVAQRNFSADTTFVIVSPLKPGKYKLVANFSDLEDFVPDTTEVIVRPGEVSVADTLIPQDTTPPTNNYLSPEGSLSDLDTLDFRDTLKFYFMDKGKNTYCHLFFNGQKLNYDYWHVFSNETRTGDTLQITLPATYKSWTYQLLTINAYDYSENQNSRTYVIKPSMEMPKPAEDASSSSGEDDDD